jgi:hypothetical protein
MVDLKSKNGGTKEFGQIAQNSRSIKLAFINGANKVKKSTNTTLSNLKQYFSQ